MKHTTKVTQARALFFLCISGLFALSGCFSQQGSRASTRSLHSSYKALMKSHDYTLLKNKEAFTKKQVLEATTHLAGDVKEFSSLLSLYKLGKRRARLYRYRISDLKRLIKDAYKHPELYLKK